MNSTRVVIASGAKQSRDRRAAAALDCFVATLLAMTSAFNSIASCSNLLTASQSSQLPRLRPQETSHGFAIPSGRQQIGPGLDRPSRRPPLCRDHRPEPRRHQLDQPLTDPCGGILGLPDPCLRADLHRGRLASHRARRPVRHGGDPGSAMGGRAGRDVSDDHHQCEPVARGQCDRPHAFDPARPRRLRVGPQSAFLEALPDRRLSGDRRADGRLGRAGGALAAADRDRPDRAAVPLLVAAGAKPARRGLEGAQAVLLLDRAGWHTTGTLDLPSNITPISLPSRAPELNPVENISQYLRANWLSNRVFDSYEEIIDAACEAWRRLIAQPETITSIGMREWAHVSQTP